MKNIIFLLLFIGLSLSVLAQNKHDCLERHQQHQNKLFYITDTRSDSIDLLHTELNVDFHELDGLLEANAVVQFKALVNNIEKIDLDLLNFTVDSVIDNGTPLAFDYNTELLEINLGNNLQANDTTQIIIYYHGTPAVDGSGFGGLIYTSGYAYNMGVGFQADPHPFGRSWFPCFDNFTERSTYEFHVLTDSTNFAYCNGAFVSREEIGEDSLITTWQMDNTIPSYLVAIGVSNYTHVEQNFAGIAGDIPVFLIARPQDTTNMKNSFVNLPDAFSTYENRFGPYRWNKVGYNLVPNTGGAMEHATNIAYPKILTNGSLTYQSIMAHELSHHWWGDLVTCSTQEDMWINEGMASYCEQLFFESLGGYEVYKDHVRDNHETVFYNAHLNDGGWLPVSGIGTENTYGYTVYLKGSDVAHVLRSYLGDDDFFGILTNFLDDNQYSDVSSEEFRDYIIAAGTDANMNAYFDNWIFNPGFPEFEIASQDIINNGSDYTVNLTINQQLYHAPELYTDVPLYIRVVDELQNTEDFKVIVSGESTDVSITTSLEPKVIYTNPNDKISQAAFGDNFLITETGLDYFGYSDFRLRVIELAADDTYWFRSECHYGKSDPYFSNSDYIISDDRFWRVRMFGTEESADSEIEGRIKYNGNESSSGYRDESFFVGMANLGYTEDSLVLMYREFGDSPWTVYDSYELTTGFNVSNWVGSIDILNLKSGDYAWAYPNPAASIKDTVSPSNVIIKQKKSWLMIEGVNAQNYYYQLYDSLGRELVSDNFIQSTEIDLRKIPAGSYILKVKVKNKNTEEIFKFNVLE